MSYVAIVNLQLNGTDYVNGETVFADFQSRIAAL